MFGDQGKSKTRKGVVALAVVIITVVAGLTLSSGSVMAASLSISSDTITTDDGDIDGVTVSASGDLTWDGAEQQPGQTTIELQVQDPDGDDWETVATTTEDLSGQAGTYSFSFTDVNVADGDTSWQKSDFASNSDGSTKETNLQFRLLVSANGDLNGDGSNPDTATSNAAETTLSVVNEQSSSGFQAGGSVEGQGTDEDPDDNEQ